MRKFWFAAAISVPVMVLSYPDLLGLDRWSFFAKGTDSLWWVWRVLGLVTLPVMLWAGVSTTPARGKRFDIAARTCTC